MKVRSLYIIVLLMALGLNKGLCIPTEYYVTDPYFHNSEHSLDVVMDNAISSANSGQNVIVYFNAPSLCEINSLLPDISIANGSITFMKDPNTISHQGIRLSSGVSNVPYGFNVNNSGTSSVTFDGLDVVGFTQSGDCDAIRLAGVSKNITIKNCNLNGNKTAIRYNNRCTGILVENNTFRNNETAIILDGINPFNSASQQRVSVVKDNVVQSTTSGSAVICSRIVDSSNPYLNHSFFV